MSEVHSRILVQKVQHPLAMEQWYNYVLFVISDIYLLVDTKELPELHAGEVEKDLL